MNSSPFLASALRSHRTPRVLTRSLAAPEPLFSLRRRRALCLGFVLVWPAFYAPRAHSASLAPVVAPPMMLRVGKSACFPLASGARWIVVSGAQNAHINAQSGTLTVRALSPGAVRVRVENPDGTRDHLLFRFVAHSHSLATPPMPIPMAPVPAPLPVAVVSAHAVEQPLVTQRAQSQLAASDPLSQMPTIPSNLGGVQPLNRAGSGLFSSGVNSATAPAGFPNGGAVINPPAGTPNGPTNFGATLPTPAGAGTANGGTLNLPDDSLAVPTPSLPDLPASAGHSGARATGSPTPAKRPPTFSATPGGAVVLRPLPPADAGFPAPRPARVSPILPQPARVQNASVPYRTTSHLPHGVAMGGPRPGIEVTQGLARLVSFPDNILSVFFSDPNVMDARAINARTIAVTGTGAGISTLAVFTARYPGDAVGRANVYRVQTVARGGTSAAPLLSRDPRAVEASIQIALADPRVRTSVVRLPDGTLAARLTGTLRNAAEVEGAQATASFYVSRVLSSLYADSSAPTIDTVSTGTYSASPEGALQSNLRRLTGNSSIELVALPGGLALKARAASAEDAEAILRILPSLGQPVMPFIVVPGQTSAQDPYYQTQALQGEDRTLTERLRAVTGITTVTVSRTSPNSAAIYGTVATRGDYETVKRYGTILFQSAAGTLRPSGIEPALPAYDPAGGYLRALGVQMFVRITDPSQATVRNVTVETSVVEISRTALRNLGAQFGTATTTGETISNGVTTRTISPTFKEGQALAGNGFGGFGGGSFIDPFRVQLNALESRGDARVLSRPNIRAVEGMPAQITIGGERPVPSAVATTGATAQSVEFRRYGVIISMRPTVSDDNTILLQIRADITQPDRTFEINLNGALIPGETVRSIDTSLAVRPGDVIIMGGLITNEKRQQTSRVPILGSIPIIGSLFQSHRFENNETELAIFMTPRIDSLPATPTTEAFKDRMPSFPQLPSRQDSNAILFQSTTRAPG